MALHSLSNFFSSSLCISPPQPPLTHLSFRPHNLEFSKSTLSNSTLTPLVAAITPPSIDDNYLVASVVCPSMAYSNIFYFKSGYFNVQIKVDENEPEDSVVNRFRRSVLRAGIVQESKRRRFFENSQNKKKRKTRDAARRNRKRRPKPRVQIKKEDPRSKQIDDEEDDNWDLPEDSIDLPYVK
ncbi:hypothetical protein K2173_001048 [Erythroxylum novogranatense]|uniref:30S ribosomal protein S21, chloroplastic n=1 Tax=Erythroxylum novogranatense TaxID=1862640 RepID=A0AAV8SIH6_9ROSI|nr:hypothetical protein K2173_001048 [Erythroxylum novogranatense]